jgi:hypothetical protein
MSIAFAIGMLMKHVIEGIPLLLTLVFIQRRQTHRLGHVIQIGTEKIVPMISRHDLDRNLVLQKSRQISHEEAPRLGGGHVLTFVHATHDVEVKIVGGGWVDCHGVEDGVREVNGLQFVDG